MKSGRRAAGEETITVVRSFRGAGGTGKLAISSIEKVSSYSLDLNTERVSQLMTAGRREFQVAGAAQLKDRYGSPMSVRLNGTNAWNGR